MSKIPVAMYRIENAHDLLDALNAINGNADILVTLLQDRQGNALDMFRVWEETLSDGSVAKTIELYTGSTQEFFKTKTPYEVEEAARRDARRRK